MSEAVSRFAGPLQLSDKMLARAEPQDLEECIRLLAVYRAETGRSAVALLDDLDSELDEERASLLCQEVAARGQALITTAHAGWARRLADGPTLSLARIKQALGRASGNDLAQQLDIERDFQRELGRSEDFKEGVAAFLAKRKPAFKGK